VSATRFLAKETIARRTIEQIKPYHFQWQNNTGQYNTAIGYQAGYYNVGSGIGINQPISNNSIQFNNTNSKPVLVITKDGDVEWHGKPSEAADCLVRSFQFAVEDAKGITKAARRRYYLRACKNILNKAEKMEHAEFLDFLKKQVYNKERRVIMDALRGEDANS
jgi:hypothetical protein